MSDWLVGRALAYTIGVPIESKVVNGEKVPVTEYSSFSDYFLALIKLATNIAIALAVLMIIWGAFKYVSSAGDDAKAKDGKDIIVGALVGLALLFLIKVIVPILRVG